MSDQEFLGRDAVVAALVAAAAGAGSALLGPPGSGVSTVLRQARDAVAGEGRRVRLVRLPDHRHDLSELDVDVLIVDDAHRATDRQILQLRDRALARAVLLGLRTGAASPDLAWLWRSGTVAQLDLDPLDDDVVGDIVERRAGGRLHRLTRDGIVHRAGGRPAFAVDEIASLVADGRLTVQSGVLRGRLTGRVGGRVTERARDVLAELPASLRAMVETVGLAGRLPTSTLAEVDVDLPELERRGLAATIDRPEGARVSLVPPALGSAVRATIAPSKGAVLAAMLLSAAADELALDDRARVRVLAGELVALDELAAAARAALRNDDLVAAMSLARQAAALGPEGVGIEAELLVECGARAEASDRYTVLMADDAAPAHLRARAALENSVIQMWDLGRPDDAVATAAALATAVAGSSFAPLVDLHLAQLTLYAGDPTAAAAIATAIDPSTFDDSGARAGLALVDTIARALVDPAGVDPFAARWLIDSGPPGWYERGVAVATVALSAELIGRYTDAHEVIEESRRTRPPADTPTSLAWSLLAEARSELAIGRHLLALRAANDAAAVFGDVSHRSGARWATGVAMFASAIGGDRDGTRAILEVYGCLDAAVPFLDVDLLRAEAWAAWTLGNSTRAAELLDRAIEVAVSQRAVTLEAVALHDSFRLLRSPVGTRLAALADRSPVPSIELRARHVAHVDAGDADALLGLAAELEAAGSWLLAAESAGDAARLAAAAGRRSLARSAVGVRVRMAAACGNPVTPALADHEQVSLTRRERDVVTLAVGGRTSREIAEEFGVSIRTVDNLLQRVYVKLGLHGRAELAAHFGPPSGVSVPSR